MPRIFYGWWIVLCCGVVNLYMGGTFFYGFTAFFEPIIEEFRWSYLAVSSISILRSIEMGIAAPIAGFIVDKLGPRKLLCFGSIMGGLGFILLSQINSLVQFYLAFFILSIGVSAWSPVVMMTIVAYWFRKRVGAAMGLLMTGFGASGLIIPILVWLINQYQWRMSLVILALVLWVISVPIILIVRHKPEAYGYSPDGEPLEQAPSDAAPEVGISTSQALRSSTFWFLAAAIAIQSMGLHSIILHVMPYLSTLGFIRAQAAAVATFIPLLSIPGRLGLGYLADLLDKRYVLTLALALQAMGMLLFSHLYNPSLLLPFLILFGVGYGGTMALRPAIQREYFGTSHYGAINGLIAAIMTLGGIIGPPFAGWVFDVRESYYIAWLTLSFVCFLAVPLALALRPPRLNLAQ